MSGYLPRPSDFAPTGDGLGAPVALFHGEDDEMVPHRAAVRTRAALAEAGCEVRLNEYPGLGHSAHMQELEDVVAWLTPILGASPAFSHPPPVR